MLIAGNWKMNTDLTDAAQLARSVSGGLVGIGDLGRVTVAVCPPFVSLSAVANAIQGSPVYLGAQNMHFEEEGAFTGEVSAAMLKSVGCRYVILGHSERRQYFGETDSGVNRKAKQALRHGLIPIVCVGETLEEREAGREQEVVREQTTGCLEGLSLESPNDLVIAYEPVWAIGTGRTATTAQAQEMHAFIRGLLREQYGEDVAPAVHILYGGSMKPGNAKELMEQPDVDGGLIGGASLKAEDFLGIVRAAVEVA